MGIVAKQSFINTGITYLGFGLGAINTLFLYPTILAQQYYGLVGYIISCATILMPIMAFGGPNALIKFIFKAPSLTQKRQLITFLLVIPILVMLCGGIIVAFFYRDIIGFLSAKNTFITPYVSLIGVITFFLVYFELFFALAKTQLKTNVGTFLKEVFPRILTIIALVLVYVKQISAAVFIYVLAYGYGLRMLLMAYYALLKLPDYRPCFKIPSDYKKILSYAGLIIVAGSIAVILVDIDRVMIARYAPIEHIAFYSVAVYMATVIAVPARAMQQIVNPLTAKLLAQDKKQELAVLYKKTASNLFSIGALVFILILTNAKNLYLLLPPAYSSAFFVVVFIAIAKLTDTLVGNANAILYNSSYYRFLLFTGVGLIVVTICLNWLLIPRYGITGAGLATLIALVLYNIAKVYLVFYYFKIHPFSKKIAKNIVLLVVSLVLFGFFHIELHPILAIAIKGLITVLFYAFFIYRYAIAPDIVALVMQKIQKKAM